MNKLRTIFLILLFIALSLNSYAAKIGVVDLSLVTAMHPKMSLFDFERLGFYKLPLGLTPTEWNKKLTKLKKIKNSELQSLEKQKKLIYKNIQECENKKRLIFNEASNDLKNQAEVLEKINDINKIEHELRTKLKEIKYQYMCPELTSLAETRKILNDIQNEIINIIKEISKKQNFDIILNASIPAAYGYPVSYETGEMFGIGVPGIDRSLLYSFIANKEHILKSDKEADSIKLIHWLELVNYPKCQNFLPIKPYPLVLCGGIHIEIQIIKKLYTKYHIDPKVTQSACSVINIINTRKTDYQNSLPIFDKYIDK